MSYFDIWNARSEDNEDQEKYSSYIQHYYDTEKVAYDKILSQYPDNKELINGNASQMAVSLGYLPDEMDLFVGFLDGISASLEDTIAIQTVEDNTPLALKINYEKLYWNMREAKADWLYNLPSWENVISVEKQKEITKKYRESKIARSEKVGRNDPCPCGSGKKYKHCCISK